MNLTSSLNAIKIITLVNLSITFFEYFKLSQIFSNDGIYQKNTLSHDFNNSLFGKTTSFLSTNKKIKILIFISMLAILTLFLINHFIPYFIILIALFFFAFKTEGSFNGGSDYMTILTVLTLFLSSLFKNTNIFICYLALQLILSYFLAGLVKIKSSSWRNGQALVDLFSGPNYAPPKFVSIILTSKNISYVFCWMVILIELFFPLLFFTKNLNLIFSLGIIFHLFNFFCFGLNRFFWSWIAAYPSLIYLLTILPSTK